MKRIGMKKLCVLNKPSLCTHSGSATINALHFVEDHGQTISSITSKISCRHNWRIHQKTTFPASQTIYLIYITICHLPRSHCFFLPISE